MKKEYSYGIVPLRFFRKKWQILLVHHHSGHWAFPKGGAEGGESPQQTAERELQEETGLKIQKILSADPVTEHYMFTFKDQLISKTVQYFIALVKGKVVIQELEIKESQWLSLSEAMERISFKEGKRICQEAIEFIKTLDAMGNPLIADQPLV